MWVQTAQSRARKEARYVGSHSLTVAALMVDAAPMVWTQ